MFPRGVEGGFQGPLTSVSSLSTSGLETYWTGFRLKRTWTGELEGTAGVYMARRLTMLARGGVAGGDRSTAETKGGTTVRLGVPRKRMRGVKVRGADRDQMDFCQRICEHWLVAGESRWWAQIVEGGLEPPSSSQHGGNFLSLTHRSSSLSTRRDRDEPRRIQLRRAKQFVMDRGMLVMGANAWWMG